MGKRAKARSLTATATVAVPTEGGAASGSPSAVVGRILDLIRTGSLRPGGAAGHEA